MPVAADSAALLCRSHGDRGRFSAYASSHWCSPASFFVDFRWRTVGTTVPVGQDEVAPSTGVRARTATTAWSTYSCTCARRTLPHGSPLARASPRSSCASCLSKSDTTSRVECFVPVRPTHAPPRSATAYASANSHTRPTGIHHRTWSQLAACPQAPGAPPSLTAPRPTFANPTRRPTEDSVATSAMACSDGARMHLLLSCVDRYGPTIDHETNPNR
jgi:hypothetical protein